MAHNGADFFDDESVFALSMAALDVGGRFVYSVEHPFMPSHDGARRDGPVRQAWIVDNYFETGRRVTTWLGAEVAKYHRTVEDYFELTMRAGFSIVSLRESRPRREHFTDDQLCGACVSRFF